MTAAKLLNLLFNAGVVVSIAATVLSLGMSYRVAELLAPLRRVWLVVLMIVVNAVLVPAAAYGIGKALPINSDAVVGLTLAAIGAASAAGLRAGTTALRACVATTVRVRGASGLRATALRTTGRLAVFLPFADFGAGLLAGINGSSKQLCLIKERAIIPADPRLYRCPSKA